MKFINKKHNLLSILLLIFTLAVVNVVSANTNALNIQNKTTTSAFNFDSIYTPISSNKLMSTVASQYQAFTIPTSNSATFKYMVWNFYGANNCTTLLQSVQIGQESQPATLGPNTYTALDAANFKICSRYGSTGCTGEYTNAQSVQVTYVYNSGSSVVGQCYNNNSNGDKLSVTGGASECTSIASCLFAGSYNPDALTLWTYVGNAQVSAGGVEFYSLAINEIGTPYVAYGDGTNSYKATVMKFNGSAWEAVGNVGFSAGRATYISLAINESGTPYVAYGDDANSSKATVMKFNGSAWESVGNAGVSAGGAAYTSLAINESGTPYVAYEDGTNSSKATVMKFNGSAWESVGNSGFSAGVADGIRLAINESGTPYVAYTEGNGGPATVMKFNGSAWEAVGNAGFSLGSAFSLSLAINESGTPYVAYQQAGSGDPLTVMKFNGN